MGHIAKRKIRIEPKFHQTDMMGVIHNAEYFLWFEEARMQFMSEIISLDEAIARGVGVPVIANQCSYKKFVRLGDPLILITEHEKKKIEMAVGQTVVTIFDMKDQQLVWRWPDDLWQRYQSLS